MLSVTFSSMVGLGMVGQQVRDRVAAAGAAEHPPPDDDAEAQDRPRRHRLKSMSEVFMVLPDNQHLATNIRMYNRPSASAGDDKLSDFAHADMLTKTGSGQQAKGSRHRAKGSRHRAIGSSQQVQGGTRQL